jgi:hypothetical protein
LHVVFGDAERFSHGSVSFNVAALLDLEVDQCQELVALASIQPSPGLAPDARWRPRLRGNSHSSISFSLTFKGGARQ